jgi:spermidine/putrescine transport system ATP-binding protein
MSPNTPQFDLACEQITKRFGSVQAVENVSFEIPSGSFFSILGPSGCGKTTLMRMIAGFEEPNEGDIRIKGHSVLNIPPNKRNVKMVFQHLALFPMMNVYDNIAYGLRCTGVSKSDIHRQVHDVLERIALPDVAKREIHQLSGGQKQRIAIARCMVLNPDVLLLDEPLGALDLKLREAMKIELKMLQHQFNTTFVYITHDQSEALIMSDHVAVMNQGRFEQVGTPQELYHNPSSEFVAGFVGDSNRWVGKVIEHHGDYVTVDCQAGFQAKSRLKNSTKLAVGDTASVFVRPEHLTVHSGTHNLSHHSDNENTKPNNPTHNTVEGRIDSLLFNGANSRLLVRDSNQELIEADITLLGTASDPKPGDAVRLSWDADRAQCF